MTRKIKILHIQETIASGGVERTRLSLAKFLDKDKFEQMIVCQHERGNVGHEIRKAGVEIISLQRSIKSIFDFKQHKLIQEVIEKFNPDIIHGAVFEGVTMAIINGLIKKVPIIIIEETSDPQNRSWRANLLMRIFSLFADKVVGVSESVTEEYLKSKLRIPKEKVVLVNNGVALPRDILKTEILDAKQKWKIYEDDFVIGSIGRMKNDHHKRYSDMIRAFAEFAKNKNDVKLLLVGGNQEFLQKYRDLANELQVSERVIFTEYQSDVTLFYKLMDVFSLVSAYEAFGLVLAEAMLNKLPIVATRVGGIKYVVDDGETGILVQAKEIPEIVNAFENLYSDKKLRKSMGENGYSKALAEFTEEAYVKKIENLYKDLTSKI